MTDLQRLTQWLGTYEGHDLLAEFRVDYTDRIPSQGAVYPEGLVEADRRENLWGDVVVTNQYNFGLYITFEKSAQDEVAASMNADWLMDFQRWVQEQTVRRLVPNFGNTATPAVARAQNGALYEAEDSGTATYMVTLSVIFEQKYEVQTT